MNMRNRFTAWVLLFLTVLSVLPFSAAAETEETLFERFIPINQAYSAQVSPFSVEVGSAYTFFVGTQFRDENKNLNFNPVIKRNTLQGSFFKISYEGTFGTLDKQTVMTAFSLSENSYKLVMGDPDAQRYENYHDWIGKDSIIVSIDLYDADKNFVQNISPYTAIMAVGPEGEFLTYSMPQQYNVSIFFSTQDNIFKGTDDIKTSSRVLHFTPEYTWFTDKGVAEGLIGSAGGVKPSEFQYEFIQYPEITGKEQYMTNNILSVNEFISPDNTYYQVGHRAGEIDPVVMNKIENVVDYSEYGLVLDAGYTRRSILTADGTLYGVTTEFEKEVLATGVKQAGKAHYMTANGEVKEIVSGKTIATDCKEFAEHRYATVIAVLKNDGSCYLGYTYLGEENAYKKGLSKVLDHAKTVVAGGVCGEDNAFYRWKEEVVGQGYDEAAWSRGEYIQFNDYVLSLEKLTDNAVRVFPDEYFTAEQSDAEEAITGFVQDSSGRMWAFGLQNMFEMGKLDLIRHIFPIYQHQRSSWVDNGNFVGLLPEDKIQPYGMVANHCSGNRPKIGVLKADYLSDVPGGYKATDKLTYAFDNDADDGSSTRIFKVKPTAFHYLSDQQEIFKALNTTTNPVGNLPLLPNVARSSYQLNNQGGNTVLLERTDGSMWMTQTYSKVSAANIVAKLGGWECSNAIQITPPTTKKTAYVDYVDLVSGGTLSTLFNLGEIPYPETEDKPLFIDSDYYKQVLPIEADRMYSDGEAFAMIICKSDCVYCQKAKPFIKAAIEREQVPIYGCVDDNSSVRFYWDFISGSTVTTPVFILVKGKGQVEVHSGVYTEEAVNSEIAKIKAAGIVSGGNNGSEQTAVQAKIPSDAISVNEFEWEVLKLVNRERFGNGESLLAMPQALQTSCNIREGELETLFDHTRPNGERPYTTIPESFTHRYVGENIAYGQTTPSEVVTAWMNSPGHRANILNEKFGYIGVGYINNQTPYWVQMFSDVVGGMTSVTTSSGKTDFESTEAMQAEYLICTDKNGAVSYLPIDINVMKRDGNAYTVELSGTTVTLTVSGESIVGSFRDVKTTDWFAKAVLWAVENKITAGTSATTFSPSDTCTRAQILTFLWRAVGSPKMETANPYRDVSPDDYFYDAALWASEKGMVTGDTFDGSTPCTRSSTVIYLWKNAGAPQTASAAAFTDVPSDSEYATAVAWAVENGVTSGTSATTFSPDNTCTRGQIVTFLNRAMQ